MVDINDIYNDPCQKIDPWCIDAFFDLKLTPSDGTELTLDNSWNTTSVDLTPAVKAAETVTHLFLTPEANPTALQYNREDYGRKGAENGGVDCISGDALSRIISMKYLKDVSQTNAPTSGDVYMYDGNLFQPYNLQTFIINTNNTLNQHSQQIDQLNTDLNNLNNVVANNYTALNNKIDQTAQQLQAQITTNANNIAALQTQVNNLQADYNAYTTATNNRLSAIEAVIAKPSYVPSDSVIAWGNINDCMNSNPTGKGIYTHNPNTNVVGDQRFN